ncbi:uncharacterized protein LOC135847300 [Planococcus citri]|uniref:uncharacterized protein LOC135847300 n=1 Tax=Planococcus citri TaxID=170843 RepID=UPI0031F8470B
MNKSIALLVFMLDLGLTLGSGSPNEENLENNTTESDSDMSCLLFGNEGCNITCAISGQLFHFQSRGSCDSDLVCGCENYARANFKDLWKQRFKSGDVLNYVRRTNKPVYDKMLEIFRDNVFKTNEELKDAHDSAISPYLFSMLETNDQHLTAQYAKNGKFDKEAVQKYVSEKLNEELKSESAAKTLLDVKYKEIFRKALETYKACKASMYNYTFKVAQVKNKHLQNILEEFFKANSMEKPEIKTPKETESVYKMIGNITVSELINRIEGDSKVEISQDENPSMSCLIFGNEGCDIGCNITGQLLNFQSDGVCDSTNICTCHNHKDRKISEKVADVKRTESGGFDKSSLEKYVTETLNEKLESTSAKSLLDVKYKEKFRKALENSKGEKGIVVGYTFKVTKLKNENLQNILNEFLNENKIEKPDFRVAVGSEKDDPIMLVNDIIVNVLINRIEENSKEEIDKDVNPSIGCLLFGKEACDMACVLYARLVNFQSYGVCDSSNICNCHNYKHSKISDTQLPPVKRTENGKFDEMDLKKYVTKNVDDKLTSQSGESLLNVDYRERFSKAMESSKNEKNFVPDYAFKIKHLKNKILENSFNEFLNKNNMKIPDSGVPDIPDEIYTILWVDNAIINTLIDRIEANQEVEIDKDVNPSIGCLLFGKEACDMACVLYARLMNFQSNGLCDSSNLCNCHNYKHRKTSESQRPAVRRTKDGKFNETDLKKYITENVHEKLKSNSGKFLLDIKYKEKFEKALENSKNEKNFVPDYAFKILHLKNTFLEDSFNEFLDKNNMKIPDSGVPDVPDEIYTILWVDNAIINTLIDRNDEKFEEENLQGILSTIKNQLLDILEIVQSVLLPW